MAFNTHQHKYSWNVFFIFKRFSPSSHSLQPPASRRKRLKAAPKKAVFQPSVLSAENVRVSAMPSFLFLLLLLSLP